VNLDGTGTDILEMSDEDFLNLTSPPAPSEEGTSDETPPADLPAEEEEAAGEEESGDLGSDAGASEEDTTSPSPTPEAETRPADVDPAAEAGDSQPEAERKIEVSEAEYSRYKAAFDQIMTPFKANGKTVELKDPEEAIKLMQMGANYTKRMQELQPHRKVLQMLQNNDLLDEGKLSYLIDLDKRNPEAIKQLVKDSGIDPLDIDPSEDSGYQAGDHRVSDEEIAFRSTLEDITSTPLGQETVQVIDSTWDPTSKEACWAQPEIMQVINTQRENGIYDIITAELERRRVLGEIPANTPFLQAYQTVGDALYQAGAFRGLSGQTAQNAPTNAGGTPQVVATRVAAPKTQVANGDKASAASPTRVSSTRPASGKINPLAMSDDEFLKQMNGRL